MSITWTPEMRAKAAATREATRLKKLAAKQRAEARREGGTFSGVGESKVFVAPEGSLEREVNIEECHLNGKLISEMGFTPEQLTLIAFKNTDEGIAAFASEKPASQFEKELRTYVPPSGEDRVMQDWQNPDLLKDAAAPFKRPGFTQRFLGERRCNEAGLRRWQPVKDSKGNLVKVGRNLFLGEMPDDLAAARRAANKAQSDAQQKEIGERMQVNQERFVREGGLPIKPGEILRSGGQAVAVEGVHIRRGNSVE